MGIGGLEATNRKGKMMEHLVSGETKFEATPREWLKVGREVATLTNRLALRDDIIAYVGNGAGGEAPARFNPALAEVEVNVNKVFGEGVNPDFVGDITLRKTQYEYPMATGAISHEAFHARFSLWSMPNAHAELKKDEYEALVLLEEGRIEYQGVQSNFRSRVFLRSSALELAIGDAREAFDKKQPTQAIAHLIGLVHARVIAGVLDEDEVADIYEWVQEQIGLENVEAFCDIIRPFQTHANHKDATELYPLAKAWAELVRKIMNERGEQENPEGGCGMPLPKEMVEEILEKMSEAGVAVEIANYGDLADQEQGEDYKEQAEAKHNEAKEQAENKEVASKVFDKSTGPGTTKTLSRLVEQREATPQERSASVIISRLLEKAKYRERDEMIIASATPPGKLRTKAIIQNKALRARGVYKAENPFRKTVRKHTDEPTLTVGIMCDISGSMGSAMKPMATTAWVMSEATRRIQGKCAMVYYGNDVFPTLKVGQKLEQVSVYTASDGTEKFYKAFQAIDGALNLLHGNGARLLVIVSDGEYTSDETRLAKEIIKKCEKAGVGVLWLPFDSGFRARELGQGYAKVVSEITDPVQASEVIGRSAMEVMTRVGQRAVA
jgi:hypothetical protein